MADRKPASVLFVCLGNICRSTMAEGVFQHLTKDTPNPLIGEIDSAGTGGYHIGAPPDSRTMKTLKKNEITTYRHAARKVALEDFATFDWIFAMDAENLEDLEIARQRAARKLGKDRVSKANVMLFGDFGGRKGEEVIDPYYGGDEGFDIAYEQMVRFTEGFLKTLEKQASGNL